MMVDGNLIGMLTLAFAVLVAVASAIVWLVRLEGRINLADQAQAAEVKARELSVQALTKFDESTQRQIEDYRTHTDIKIDVLGRDLKAELGKIFDKLDLKEDKAR